jgi:hypothetical protein
MMLILNVNSEKIEGYGETGNLKQETASKKDVSHGEDDYWRQL